MQKQQQRMKRSPNFSSNEKEVLLSLVLRHKEIIENKKTDAVSVNQKKQAWFKITQDFNTASPNNCFRETESLKKYYENLKEGMRKRAGEQRQSLYKTGGGPPSPVKKDGSDNLLLELLNKEALYGLCNSYDSDKMASSEASKEMTEGPSTTITDVEVVFEDTLPQELDTESFLETLNPVPELSNRQPDKLENNTTSEVENVDEDSHSWGRIKPTDLKRQLHPKLKENLKKTYVPLRRRNNNKHEWNYTRRRPTTIKTLSSSTLGEKYEALIDKKMHLAEGLQKEHELRMTLLRFEIALKKKRVGQFWI